MAVSKGAFDLLVKFETCFASRVQVLWPEVSFFFFNDTATTEIYTLSLHDALPIWPYSVCEGWNSRLKPAFLANSPDRKSTRLNSSHLVISYAVFCLKKKRLQHNREPGLTPVLITRTTCIATLETSCTFPFASTISH